MIDWLRRAIRRTDQLDNIIAEYHDATSEDDLQRIEQRLHAHGVDLDQLRTVRETSRLLRSLDTVQAPRSYTLTPESLAARGYSQAEIDTILNPSSGWSRLRSRNTAIYVPLAIAAVALVGVALLNTDDLSQYFTDRFEESSEESTAAQMSSQEMKQHPDPTLADVPIDPELTADVLVEEILEIDEIPFEAQGAVSEESEVEMQAEIAPNPNHGRTAENQKPTPVKTEAPCLVLPTTTPTMTVSPTSSVIPRPTATISSIPTCTPTPTPVPTPSAMSSQFASLGPTLAIPSTRSVMSSAHALDNRYFYFIWN